VRHSRLSPRRFGPVVPTALGDQAFNPATTAPTRRRSARAARNASRRRRSAATVDVRGAGKPIRRTTRARACQCPAPGPTCAKILAPACDHGMCTLACAPTACACRAAPAFSTDAKRLLDLRVRGDRCASCIADTDCTRRCRQDCCGCVHGGKDTAVANGDALAHEPADVPAKSLLPRGRYMSGGSRAAVRAGCLRADLGRFARQPVGRPDLMDCASVDECTLDLDATARRGRRCVCANDLTARDRPTRYT